MFSLSCEKLYIIIIFFFIRRFKLDGIVYNADVPKYDGILRYATIGSQRSKQRIVQQLIPGDDRLLRVDELTRDERCLLHFAMSNTIWDRYESSEENFCAPGPHEGSFGIYI